MTSMKFFIGVALVSLSLAAMASEEKSKTISTCAGGGQDIRPFDLVVQLKVKEEKKAVDYCEGFKHYQLDVLEYYTSWLGSNCKKSKVTCTDDDSPRVIIIQDEFYMKY